MPIPIIDLFAGPGGLGEGFSRARNADFRVAVSVEKDGMAFETLQLRAAHRALIHTSDANGWTWRRWDRIIAETPWNIVFETLRSSGDPLIARACEIARDEAWNLELGPTNRNEVRQGIQRRLGRFVPINRMPTNTVLIGGPPCQAYSIVGRSRNRGTLGYRPERDQRHFLYKEYLQVINDFRPAVFVMENVKGMLTSKVQDRQIFQTILEDIRRPDLACSNESNLEYVLISFSGSRQSLSDPAPEDFIVEAECYGVPQARHRVIIGGIRRDVYEKAGGAATLTPSSPPCVRDVIHDLPRIRPALSYRGMGLDWTNAFESSLMSEAVAYLRHSADPSSGRVAARMIGAARFSRACLDPGTGADRLQVSRSSASSHRPLLTWYLDRPTSLLSNHEARAHMPSDLVRYLFVSSFGRETGRSPKLSDFPPCLLPEHRNIDPTSLGAAIFKDRFRVQLGDRYSMTVTSHIAKDGHAFIHYDEMQCRSLTVREAARLQTFPDSYVFLGNRTSQYTQVGNAVPPYLAVQIAEVVGDVMARAGLS
jgi:DNA (cytosine-5)-methyltransferase 1